MAVYCCNNALFSFPQVSSYIPLSLLFSCSGKVEAVNGESKKITKLVAYILLIKEYSTERIFTALDST